jgi:hypothetical protein
VSDEGRLETVYRLLKAEASGAAHERPPDWRTWHQMCDLLAIVERIQATQGDPDAG